MTFRSVWVANLSTSLQDDMTCTGQSSQKKDLYDGVERMAAKKAANSKPGEIFCIPVMCHVFC
jgi:hypothetical protein